MPRKRTEESRFDKVLRDIQGSDRATRNSRKSSSSNRFSKDQPHAGIGAGIKKGKRARHARRFIFALTSLLLILGAFHWVFPDILSSPQSFHWDGSRAVIVDQLSAEVPDSSFVGTAKTLLADLRETVDYYGAGNATVGLFRDLPLRGYSLVIIRAHTGNSAAGLAVFTSELYSSSSYVYEQFTDQIVDGTANGHYYFAITPEFVRDSMAGRFHGSVIIVMGCNGILDSEMAQAFMDRGASSYVGWDRLVTVDHSDAGTLALLRSVLQGKSIVDSVNAVSTSLGPDPFTGGRLRYYDSTTGRGQRITQFLLGLGAFFAILAVMVLGPVVVILIPKWLSRL